MKTWALIRDGLLESRRKILFLVILGVSLLAVAGLSMFQYRDDGLYAFGQPLSGPFSSGLNAGDGSNLRGLMAVSVWSIFESLALGMVGALLCLIATAGFVPDFLKAGRVDLTLSRPVRRSHVLLAKYISGLLFVAIHSGIFVVLSWLVIWINSGEMYFGMLIAWPLMIYQFTFLYAFSVLIGVMSRSTISSILATIGFWVTCNGLNNVRAFSHIMTDWPAWLRGSLDVSYWILPKVADINRIAKQVQWSQWQVLYAQMDTESKMIWSVNPALSIGTSLAFAAVLLTLAMWRFNRKDF